MSNIIQPNQIFALRCLGNIEVQEHQFLSGQATSFSIPGTAIRGDKLSLSLVGDLTATGASWLTLDGGSSKLRFSCFANTFLQGDLGRRTVGIGSAAQEGNGQSVGTWDVVDLDFDRRQVRLLCDGLFLNGKTVEGILTLETDPSLSGTRWEIASLGDPAEGFPPPPHGNQ
jgi:hypothetical protein